MKAELDRRTSLTFGDLTREHRRSRPDRSAVVDGDITLTYRQLDERANKLATAMLGYGLGHGDRIAWLGQNSFRVLELLVAAAKLGAVFCPVNWRSSEAELRFVLEDLDPAIVVWQDQELGDTARAARESAGAAGIATGARWLQHDADAGDESYEGFLAGGRDEDPDRAVAGEDPLLAMYTAAFGGTANAALLSHTALIVQNLVIGRMQDITDETVFLNSGPLFHIATFMSTNATLHHGGSNVFVRRTDPAEMCAVIEAERCTHAVLMGPTLDAMIEHNRTAGHDLTSLWPTGDPNDNRSSIVTPDTAPWRHRPGGYGQTEVVGLTTFLGPGSPTEGRAGRPSPAVAVRIVDDAGDDVAPGEAGEIVVRGLTVMSGYWRRDDLNAERGATGWHRTNDLGRRETDGSITFIGPRVAMIKSAAENIYPAEVEACLVAHPAVRAACVIGVPDPKWTQRVKAVVVLDADAVTTAEELIEHCRSRMASYKKPSEIVFVDSLPRTPVGFVDRDAVDEQFGGGGYPGTK
jgi:long-chain acyl-CoA synthetase